MLQQLVEESFGRHFTAQLTAAFAYRQSPFSKPRIIETFDHSFDSASSDVRLSDPKVEEKLTNELHLVRCRMDGSCHTRVARHAAVHPAKKNFFFRIQRRLQKKVITHQISAQCGDRVHLPIAMVDNIAFSQMPFIAVF